MEAFEEPQIKLKKIHAVVLEMLCDIDSFCKENNIRWFLSGGSCLGAVRHKGFIPWDYDADIMLPRPDYERFLIMFKSKYKEKYGLGSYETDKDWQFQFARIWSLSTVAESKQFTDLKIGVYIDVFPIDGLPENSFERNIHYKLLKFFCVLKNTAIKGRNSVEGEKFIILKKIASIITKPIGARYFIEKIDWLAKRNCYNKAKYIGAYIVCHYGDKETIEKNEMDDEVRLQFEGHLFPVPKGYHKYLTNLYGNYMAIPKDAEKNAYMHLDRWTIKFK